MRANQPGAGAGRRPARASLLRLSLPSLLLALGLVSMAPPVAAEAAPAPAAEAARLPLPFPKLGLLKPLRGEAAIAALGGRLPEIAAWYGMSAER
ncbi:MAG TPA: hypothetical protein VLI06_14460, partial [Solimonas sp.]|nr:hypothetical protein [Solimonas sp.]